MTKFTCRERSKAKVNFDFSKRNSTSLGREKIGTRIKDEDFEKN
jgi:hypothetical protein